MLLFPGEGERRGRVGAEVAKYTPSKTTRTRTVYLHIYTGANNIKTFEVDFQDLALC